MDSRQKKRKVNRKRRVLKITLLVSTVLLLALGAGFWYIYSQVSNTASNSYEQLERGDKSNLRVEPVDVGKDNFSMLLLGSDYREGDDYERTDTLIVATFNKSDRSIILTSIPRDTYTEIIGYHGGGIYDKINHAHAFGGMSMAVDTVENLLDIPIDHYALIRFDGFVEVIDALGGVEVDVTYEFDFKEASTNADYSFTEGPTQMDGSKALAYARERKSVEGGGDKGRGIRQQQIIESVINESTSISNITNFDDVLQAVGNNLRMDLTMGNIVSLSGYAGSINEIESMQLQTEGFRQANAQGQSIWYERIDSTSLQEIQTTLKDHLEIDDSLQADSTTQ